MSKVNLPGRESRGRRRAWAGCRCLFLTPESQQSLLCHCVSPSQVESKTKKYPQGCTHLGGQLKIRYLVSTQEHIQSHSTTLIDSSCIRTISQTGNLSTGHSDCQRNTPGSWTDRGTCLNKNNPKMRTLGLAPIHRAPGDKKDCYFPPY